MSAGFGIMAVAVWLGLAQAEPSALPVLAPGVAAAPSQGPGADKRWLAPGPALLAEESAALERRLLAAEAVGEAVIRLQNRIGERLAAGAKVCADPEARELVARVKPFGAAWRDAAQAARAQSERVEHLRQAPTLAPLLDDAERGRLERLHRRAEKTARLFLEARAWQRQHVEPQASRKGRGAETCPEVPSVGPGLAPGEPATAASGDVEGAVAVIGIGGGRLCPANLPADGVAVLESPRACWDPDDTCTCKPEPVLPGAVLGPK